MLIKECTYQDIPQLALMNKHLIEDEESNNPMSIAELESRMSGFINNGYNAYFFIENEIVLGYDYQMYMLEYGLSRLREDIVFYEKILNRELNQS